MFLLLIGAAALASWAWSRPQPPRFQPPKLWKPQPTGRRPSAPLVGLVVGLVVVGWTQRADWTQRLRGWLPPAAASPCDQAGPDLLPAFRQADDRAAAREDAATFGALCEKLAEVLEYDGQRETPRIITGAHVDEFRRALREYRLAGRSLGKQYPLLAEAIDAHLTHAVGVRVTRLDPAQRASWVRAFRELAASGQCAALRL